MSIEGILAGLVILAILLTWVGWPLLGRQKRTAANEILIQKQRERVLMVYERILNNIRDLDEDYSTGKMPDGDYQAERELWVQRGIQALKSLDELDARTMLTSSTANEDIDQAIDRKIEE